MTARRPVNPGRVEWSGDNPGIYLRRDPAGPYSALALFFRVVLSAHGRGSAMLILGDPDQSAGWPDARNLCITDNQALARYLLDDFVANMPSFRGKAAVSNVPFLPLTAARSTGRTDANLVEEVQSHAIVATMAWEQLGTPFAVEVNQDQSATGTHEMVSIFVEARSARITLDGKILEGVVSDRQLFGKTLSTAFLAFSETWIKPG